MTKIYLGTNGYDLIAVVDHEEEIVHFGTPTDIPNHPTEDEATDYLDQLNCYEWIGILQGTMDIDDWTQMIQKTDNKIIAEIAE